MSIADDSEDRIRRRWFRSLSRWMDRVRPQVLPPGSPPQTQNVDQNRAFWGDLMQSEVMPEVTGLYQRVRNRMIRQDEPVTDADSAAYLNEAGNRLVRVPDEVYALIVREVEQGIARGESVPDIRDRIKTVLTATGSEYWPNRATVVARTECLPGSVRISGALATAVYRRWYEGQWVELTTASGRKISGTPNHPVLTQRGWVGLGKITESDHLICDRRDVEKTCPPADQDIKDTPPTIAEVFDATAAVVVPERKAAAEPDFHGDGRDGYVDVLSAYGVLRIGLFFPVTESRCDSVLAPSDLAVVVAAAQSAPFSRGVPVSQAMRLSGGTDYTPCLSDTAQDGFLAALESCSQCGGPLPRPVPAFDFMDGKIVPLERPVSGGQESLTSFGHASTGARPLDGIRYRVCSESGASGYLPVTETRGVEIDRVARVVFTQWSGHVYNLTTVDGYFSVNDGVYTGNTQGAVNAGAYYGAIRDAQLRGDPAPFKVWISTQDQRTRPTHVAADKQRTLLTEPFTVGGAKLLFPGDPRGPAQEVIQCRCSVLPITLGEQLDWTDRQDP